MFLNKFSDFYKKYEKYISPVGLIYGFILTWFTLTRVDTFLENFWIVVNMLIACFGILAITLVENRVEKKKFTEIDREKFHFYLTLIIQFAFGGLFSTFFVFYIRSSSFAQSWPFLFILLVLLVGNELWKKHYQRLAFQISILFISVYLFLVFLLPVLVHRLGADLFVYSGVISLVLVFLFTMLLKKFALERFKSHHNAIKISIVSIFIVMNILYFTNIIPPIPLSLKTSGAYHNVTKLSSGDYEVKAEVTSWTDYFKRYPVFHRRSGESIYVFSAVFSPVNFSTEVVHQWQYYDELESEWIDSSRIVAKVNGGREEGYRMYSLKNAVFPGLWRVKVMTPKGQLLGKINFEIKDAISDPAFEINIL